MMVKFIDVQPDQIPNMRDGRRGRVSYPILKSFMETGKTAAQLDRTGIQQKLTSLTSSLSAYIRNHNLPIRMVTRGGQIYLLRTDMDDAGNVAAINIDTVKFDPKDDIDDGTEPVLISSDEVAKRFAKEKGNVTA